MNTRHVTLVGGAFIFAGLCAGDTREATPLAPIALQADGVDARAIPTYQSATHAQRVRITRDPFVAVRTQTKVATEPLRAAVDLPVLPPNTGASVTPPYVAGSGSASSVDGRLVAVVVGRRRFALLASGGAVRIIAVGDLVGPRRVVRITLSGIAFDDSSSLHLQRGI